MVVDPRRDAAIYDEMAKDQKVRITHIFETHRNEDCVIGSLELQSYISELKIGHSRNTKFGYGDIDITDGDRFEVGSMMISCLSTPGHTEDSKDTGGHEILPDGDGLFTHVFRCTSGHRQIGDTVSQPTGFNHLRTGNQQRPLTPLATLK